MDRQRQCAFVVTIVVANSSNMFNANELKDDIGHSMDSNVGVQDVFAIMRTTLGLFKPLTNFILAKFDESCTIYT